MNAIPPPVKYVGEQPEWPLWQRIGFRYLCLHWLLYAMPRPITDLVGMVGQLIGTLQEYAKAHDWFDVQLNGWVGPFYRYVGMIEEWWQALTTWVGGTAAGWISDSWKFEVIHQRTGSGDTMHDWVKFGCIAFFAVLLTVLWSILDRRRTGHPLLGRWLHLGARWYVGVILLGYGMSKFYGGQFGEPTIAALTREVGDHSPMGIVWTFMSLSDPYKYLSGIGEVASFVLLLHRRTALFGAVVTIAVMANIAAINWMYGWPVKLFSGHLLVISFFLMAPYWSRLWAVFVTNKPSVTPVDMRVTRMRWLGWPLMALGLTLGIATFWQSWSGYSAYYEKSLEAHNSKPELFGYWTVEQFVVDGVTVSPGDSSRWQSLVVDRGHSVRAKTLLGQVHSWKIEENLAANEVTLKPGFPAGENEVWTIERSTVTRKAPHPRPRTPAERQPTFDAERDAIVWRGKWQGKALEVHTVKKVFRIEDAFRLIREMPR